MRTNPSRASDHTGLDYISPTTHPASDSEGFRAIRAAPQQLMNAEQDLFQAVAQARLAGDSWTTIGAALGTTRQVAQQRFNEVACPSNE